jgi:dTDP-4-amino-4,6-dideoxygalactose transaminase
MIPYAHQDVDDDDIEAVVAVLRGDWLTGGPAVASFEEQLAATVEAKHAVAFSNGTAALHGAMSVAGIGPGDVVATSPLTFVASANCARYVGADVVLVDIESETLLVDLGQLPHCDGLVAVHYAGLPADLADLPFRPRVVIEDAAHALGATTADGPVGNCARSDMCMFSFHPVKHITTGEGGIITTNSDELASRLRRFRSHGTVPLPERGGWYYEVVETGFNYRLTDVQAALGSSQLRKLHRFLARRRELAARYRRMLDGMPVVLPPGDVGDRRHAYHLFTIQVEARRKVYEQLRASGIGVQVHYVPLYRHPLLADLGPPERFPNCERAYDRLLSLPMFPSMSDADQDAVVAALEVALR